MVTSDPQRRATVTMQRVCTTLADHELVATHPRSTRAAQDRCDRVKCMPMRTLERHRLALEIQDVDTERFVRVLWSSGREMRLLVGMSPGHPTSRAPSMLPGVCLTLTPIVMGVIVTLFAGLA
jgi:hypothetical protein